MTAEERIQVFECMPVHRAVYRQILPAVISQMIALIYNLADTYFVGLLNAPAQTAAVTVAYPSFLMLTAISNLFGVGGASAFSRALGKHDRDAGGEIYTASFWMALLSGAFYVLLFACFRGPILRVSGATDETWLPVVGYTRWAILIGGIPVVLNVFLANMLRAEGIEDSSVVFFPYQRLYLERALRSMCKRVVHPPYVEDIAFSTVIQGCISSLYHAQERVEEIFVRNIVDKFLTAEKIRH